MTKDRNELQKLAYGTLRLVKEFKHAQNRRSDLDRVTFEILMLIRQKEQVRLTDIANELDFNPSSITRRIQSLKQSGYIAVISDPKDLRSSLIRLTEIGEGALLHFLEKSIDGLEHILKDWNDDEIKVLADKILRLADSMSDWRIAADKTEGVSPNDVRE
ncbi:MarR family winged helix-turn-helix transcriptional regulator [Paenibacillus allorhizosphaerae]|uniref:HTH marR-type domain-containing protein n=1 Tax=Paenibacillus allorhizosphaerae TaxID=2849866 RepID=A0ABM8VAP3_9BACL|nr:MarR family transcriptional regulator [Paenibacillus allorhizosphaerae]CAG7616440.1 hypothetical protein PAECIP111802_00288 [Paenibacillus allorhizosphaerae]